MGLQTKSDPMKLLNLRVDTLSQILTMTNVHSGGRYLVYETGAQGLVVASVLERVGGRGSVTHIYQTGQPQTNCLAAMDFPPEVLSNLHVLNVQHLRSLEQGQDILANHPRPEAENTGEPPNKKLATEAGVETSNGGASEKLMRMSLREKSVATDNKLTADKCDGVIIVFKQHPGALLIYISKVSLSF